MTRDSHILAASVAWSHWRTRPAEEVCRAYAMCGRHRRDAAAAQDTTPVAVTGTIVSEEVDDSEEEWYPDRSELAIAYVDPCIETVGDSLGASAASMPEVRCKRTF